MTSASHGDEHESCTTPVYGTQRENETLFIPGLFGWVFFFLPLQPLSHYFRSWLSKLVHVCTPPLSHPFTVPTVLSLSVCCEITLAPAYRVGCFVALAADSA